MHEATPLYAAIDLGSNSFHMLVAREIDGCMQVVTRIKRKVRLAAGLDNYSHLSKASMQRGWQCLELFSEQLQDIPINNRRIVATATLRAATNARSFLLTAEKILNHPIHVISGLEEAQLIYQGVIKTTGGANSRLIIDIGGASTELIVGTGNSPSKLFSLEMGCVTWLEHHFREGALTIENFAQAELAATQILSPIIKGLSEHTWQSCVGASGTLQALQEIMFAQGMDEQITLNKLQHLKQQVIACGGLEDLKIEGLTPERAQVFPSGLAILLTLFHVLKIEKMTLAGGALREGIIYSMLPVNQEANIQHRTVSHLQHRYELDIDHANRVSNIANLLFNQVAEPWELNTLARNLLLFACQLHEIGLSVNFNQAHQHAAYLINHSSLPGFTSAQKKLIAALLLNQTHAIDLHSLSQQNALPAHATFCLCRLFRLSLIFASSRRDSVTPSVTLMTEHQHLILKLPLGWLQTHPLSAERLLQESHWQHELSWPLSYGEG